MRKILLLVTTIIITLISLQMAIATQPIRQPCIDSDSGRNYFIAGSVTYGSKVIVDTCQNERYIREADCGTNYGIKYRDGCSHSGPGICRYDCTKILNPYGTGTMCYDSRCVGYYLTINESIDVEEEQDVEYFTRAHLMRSEEDLLELHADSAVEIVGEDIQLEFGADTNAPMRNLRATAELLNLDLEPLGIAEEITFDLIGRPGLHTHQRVSFNLTYPEDFVTGWIKITLEPKNLQSISLYVPVVQIVEAPPQEACEENPSTDLPNFRCIFLTQNENDEYQFNGKIVVASAGIDVDYNAAYYIVRTLEQEGIETEGIIVNDTDEAAYAGVENLIVIGGSCINTVTANLRGNPESCTEYISPGLGYLEFFKEEIAGENRRALVVEGYSAEDVDLAAQVLMAIPNENLEATEDVRGNFGICEGTTLENSHCEWITGLNCGDIYEEDDAFFIGNELLRYSAADDRDTANPMVRFQQEFHNRTSIEENVNFDNNGNGVFTINLEGNSYNFVSASRTERNDWDIQHVSGTIDGRPFLC